MGDYHPRIRVRQPLTPLHNQPQIPKYHFDADAYFATHPRTEPDYNTYLPTHGSSSIIAPTTTLIFWVFGVIAMNLVFRYFLSFVAQFQHLWPRAALLEPGDYWPFKSQRREFGWSTEEEEDDEETEDEEEDGHWD
ncbi:hypothetical protein B0T14DRAFT_570403 [Immersiella caudata]|uniref:Uncharacterized protein n=1 Tax=Immersiella caudata TaxID=314043 RepID=A0AA40BUS9_9PEZI|nr:hypothetical protein B0T14DRAFT_570403 [Immersiella caudata]